MEPNRGIARPRGVPVSHAMRGRAPEYKRRARESEGIRKRRDPGDAPRPATKNEPETKKSTSNRRNRPDTVRNIHDEAESNQKEASKARKEERRKNKNKKRKESKGNLEDKLGPLEELIKYLIQKNHGSHE